MRHCFIEALKEAGYNTGWYGKWHQGWDVSNHPLNNGFDNAYGFLGGMHDYFDPSEGDHYVGGPFAKNCYVFDGIRPVGEMKYLTEEITDRALDFVGQVKDDRNPFFMYLAYNCPHTPMQAPDDVIIKYLNKGMDAVSATRCAMIDVMDAGIGRLLDKLESEGLRKNTLVVFMSDNGAERVRYNGGLRGTKMTAWEGGVRVPMVASYPPRIPYGTRSASICSIMDMASTFIGLAKGDDGFAYRDGVNLLPYYTGEKDGNAHESLVFAINLSGQAYSAPAPELLELFAVRSGDWKLVVDNKQGIDALYNLKDDMGESTDLSDVFADKKKELYEYGVDFLAECPPSCSKIRSVNTRINGDKIKFDSLKVHCEKLKEKLK